MTKVLSFTLLAVLLLAIGGVAWLGSSSGAPPATPIERIVPNEKLGR